MTDTEPLAFERPPIRQGTTVEASREHTFDTFVRRIGDWWPLRPYSIGQDRIVSVTFEERAGGRVYEAWDDGSEVTWGHLLDWNPPEGFTMTWEVLPAVTEVELTFRSLGPRLTRVDLVHRGWDRLTSEQLAAATSAPGGYEAGWARVLEALRSAATAQTQ